MHLTLFHEILRDAEVANSIAPIVRKHGLTVEETAKALLQLHVPRAANVARITFR
jgi:hypothetical protein